MSKPSDSKGKSPATGVDRRSLFLMGGSAVAAAAVVPLAGSDTLQTRLARGSVSSLHQHVRDPINSG